MLHPPLSKIPFVTKEAWLRLLLVAALTSPGCAIAEVEIDPEGEECLATCDESRADWDGPYEPIGPVDWARCWIRDGGSFPDSFRCEPGPQTALPNGNAPLVTSMSYRVESASGRLLGSDVFWHYVNDEGVARSGETRLPTEASDYPLTVTMEFHLERSAADTAGLPITLETAFAVETDDSIPEDSPYVVQQPLVLWPVTIQVSEEAAFHSVQVDTYELDLFPFLADGSSLVTVSPSIRRVSPRPGESRTLVVAAPESGAEITGRASFSGHDRRQQPFAIAGPGVYDVTEEGWIKPNSSGAL